MLYQLKNGCNWHYKKWRDAGIFEKMLQKLHKECRIALKNSKYTSLMMINSQAVKNTCNAAKNISDDQGLIKMLTMHINYFKSKPTNRP